MKLSKTQITALANKIVTEITKIKNEKNFKVLNSVEYKEFYNRNAKCIKFKKMMEEMFPNGSSYTNTLLHNYRDSCFKDKLSIINIPTSYNIEQDIVLSTIVLDNNTSLDELIANITSKYIK